MIAENKLFFSFDKNYSSDVFFKQPEKYRELEDFSKDSKNLITVGSNLSYSPLCFEKNSLGLVLKKFNRIINFDLENKEITVEAGINLAELLNFTLKYNLWIPQLPGYPSISIGGAVATNAHGKSCAIDGTIRNSIKKILLFHKTNGWLNLSENENKEIYDLTIGGLGLTGTIVNVTISLNEINCNNFITKKMKVNSLEESVENIITKSKNKNSFIYSWNSPDDIMNFGKGIIFENVFDQNKTKQQINLPSNIRKNFFKIPFSLWNKHSIKFANFVFFLLNTYKNREIREKFLQVIFPFYGKEGYFNLFGKKGFLESQLLIDKKNINEFFDEFKYLYKEHEPVISLLSFKNMSGVQKYLRFEGNKVCMTIDYVNKGKSHLFMREIDKLCKKFKILPSIIKDSRIDRETFESCYLESIEFKQKLYDFDRSRVYKSEISKRLGL